MDFSDDNETAKKVENSSENATHKKPLPGKAVKIVEEEEKPFKTNDELPEAELYYGGELGDKEPESESERDMRLIKICQGEEMKRL